MIGTEPATVAELLEDHGRMIFTTAYRILGTTHDAEDVLQDVFLRVLKIGTRSRKADRVRDWGAYLRVMATRRAVDVLRDRRRLNRVDPGALEALEGPPGQNPRRATIRDEMAVEIREALGTLPKRDSVVFSLRYFDDLTYDEIARELRMSVTAVGVLLHRTRKRLRTRLSANRTPAASTTCNQLA